MRGSYEQQWQDAVSGATVIPDARVWENISSELDLERGRRGWVTFLLIAATVTVAFAFPMTIGNSELQNRINLEHTIASNETQELGGSISLKDRPITKSDVETTQEVSSATKPIYNGAVSKGAIENKADLAISTKNSEDNITVQPSNSIDSEGGVDTYGPNTARIGFSSFSANSTLFPANIDDYYFIPFYTPSVNSKSRNLLASFNMGTGSLKAGSGIGEMSFANSDGLSSSLNDASHPDDNRVENTGSTFYFGTGVELPIGSRWSFLVGVGYLAQVASGESNMVLDQDGERQPMGAYDPIVPGTIFLGEAYSYSVTNSYINMPLTFKYPFINRKIKLRGGIGLSTDFMVAHVINSDEFGKANYNPAAMNYNPVVFAGIVNIDLSYNLNSQYAVAFETGFRKGFTAIDQTKDFYPSSFTAGLVLFYKIR